MPPVQPRAAYSAPLRRSAWALAAAVGIPLLWSLVSAASAGLHPQAWVQLAQHSQTAGAFWQSAVTGVVAFGLALTGAALLLALCFRSARWARLLRPLPAMLALPHAAFAVGFVLLLAPTGWLVRLGVALLTPFNSVLGLALDAPPPWPTTQDPWGLGLVVVLALKEIPFLLWVAAAQLQRPDVAQRLGQELQLAQTLGYSARSAWWRVAWPQLVQRLQAPMLAVLVYSLTVVDVALLAGPSTPPTLAVLAWEWLQDADPARNAMGAAAAWLLAAMAALLAIAGGLLQRHSRRRAAARWTRGHALPALTPGASSPQTLGQQVGRLGDLGNFGRLGSLGGLGGLGRLARLGRVALHHARAAGATALAALLPVAYGAVALALAMGSVIGVWPFPDLWPQAWTWQAWHTVADSAALVGSTLALGLASACAALGWTVAWFECAPAHWQHRAQGLCYLPLLLPTVLWALGLHRLALAWGLDATWGGLWLAHTLCALPYVVLSLQGSYAGFDARLHRVAASLGRSRWSFVWQVKWPLLRAALAASFAVGFAVSVAQYLPTLYVGAGRFATINTEAVALASGGARSLLAAFAALLWLLPALVFALSAWLGRPRIFRP